jgi:hypothetical protein
MRAPGRGGADGRRAASGSGGGGTASRPGATGSGATAAAADRTGSGGVGAEPSACSRWWLGGICIRLGPFGTAWPALSSGTVKAA